MKSPNSSIRSGTVLKDTEVSLSAANGATIFYTTDGTEPTASSPVYSSPITINVAPMTIKAMAVMPGLEDSPVAWFTYDFRAHPPVANYLNGTILAVDQIVRLSSETPGAVIHYTTDGSEPTINSKVYDSGIRAYISGTEGKTGMTIRAKAFGVDDILGSYTSVFHYPIGASTSPPTSSHASGSIVPEGEKVTLSAGVGAVICYTTDGSEPSCYNYPAEFYNKNTLVYSSPIMIIADKNIVVDGKPAMTIKAKAFRNGSSESSATFTYIVGDPAPRSLNMGDVDVPISNNVPLIGRKTFGVDFNNLSGSTLFDGDRFMIAIGNTFSSANKGKSPQEKLQAYQAFRRDIDSWKNDVFKSSSTESPRTSSFGITPSLQVMGYLEGAINKGEFSTVTGKVKLQFKMSGQYNMPPVMFGPFPITVTLGLKAVASLTGSINSENFSELITTAVLNAVIPEIELKAGIGIPKVARLGLYGAAALHFYWDMGTNYKLLWLGGSAGGFLEVPFHTFKHTFISRRWDIGEWNGAASAASMAMYQPGLSMSSIYDGDNYTLSPRNYLGSQSPWLGNQVSRSRGAEDIKVLQESVYNATAPLMAEARGKRIMVFLADDGSRDIMNRTKLMYTLYDAGLSTWSEPRPVFDDGTADFYPHISSDGNNIWLTWHKSKAIFTENTELEDMLAAAEIAAARFDFDTEMFADVTVLTDNDIMDTAPVVAVNGNEAFVTWVRNTDNDIFGINGTNSAIMARQFTNGAWGETLALGSGLGAVLDMTSAYFDGKFQVAYVTGNDNDLGTITNRSLVVMDSTGAVTYTPVIGKLVSSLQFTDINGARALSWFENEEIIEEALEEGEEDLIMEDLIMEGYNIRYMTAGGQISSMFDTPDMTTDSYKIFSDSSGNTTVVYPELEDETGYIYARTQHAGEWGKPFKLAETGDFAKSFDGILEDNGEFNIVFNNSRMLIIGEGDDAELFESNNLSFLSAAPQVNINLGDISYISDDVRKGQPLLISLDVENTGGIPVNSVNVKVNEAIIGTFPITGGLKAGETATVDFALNIPADMPEQTEFAIGVEPDGMIDIDLSDNSSVITLGHSNFILRVEKNRNEDDTVTVIANVENTSDFDANTKLLVRMGTMDGDIIDIVDLGIIAGRNVLAPVELSFDPRTLVPEGEEYATLYFELISDREYFSGSFDFVVIFAVEDIPEIVTIPVAGVVTSYYPGVPTIIRLLQDGDVKYTTTIEPMEGTGQKAQVFVFSYVQPGVYTLEITKAGHLSYVLESLAVDENGVLLDDTTLIPLESIKVTTLPAKTIYVVGETLNIAGMAVTATYGGVISGTVTGYTTSPVAGDRLNTIGKQTVIVGFEGKTDSFIITVNDTPGTGGKYTYEVDGILYSSFDKVLQSIPDNTPTTIKLLNDVDPLLVIDGKIITFDLNGYDLSGGLQASAGSVITLIGDVSGEIIASGDETVVNIEGNAYNGVSAYDRGIVNVEGDVYNGVFAYEDGTVNISGNVYDSGVNAWDYGNVIIGGDVDCNVIVNTGGTVTIDGKLKVESGDFYIMVDEQGLFKQDGFSSVIKPGYIEYTIDGTSTVWVKLKAFIYGDVNDDGRVTLLDSTILARWLAMWEGVEINEAAADVNGDGRVTLLDQTVLRRHLAMWEGYEILPWQRPPQVSPVQVSAFMALSSPFMLNDTFSVPAINVSNATGKVGEIVEMRIELSENPGIIGMRLGIEYDESKIRLADVIDGGNLGEAYHRNVYSSPYTLLWANGASATNFNHSGDVVTLLFEILSETAGSPVTISYDAVNGDVLDIDLKPVNFEMNDGFVSTLPVKNDPIKLVNAVPTASVKKQNGNKNDLTITVTETYSDGSTNKITETFSINNNAAGSYQVGTYIVYVDTKGNDQIRQCYIVK